MSEVSTVSTVRPILFLISLTPHLRQSRYKIGETVDTSDTADTCHLPPVLLPRTSGPQNRGGAPRVERSRRKAAFGSIRKLTEVDG